jgi:hypothetical protein
MMNVSGGLEAFANTINEFDKDREHYIENKNAAPGMLVHPLYVFM